jgi:hypothetical protein
MRALHHRHEPSRPRLRSRKNTTGLPVLTRRGEATGLGRLPPAETILTDEFADKNTWTIAQI